MSTTLWPIAARTARSVLWRILLNGTPLRGCKSVDIHATNHRKASTLNATFSLSADPSAVATWTDADPPLLLEVQASAATGGAAVWQSVFTGEASDVHIDPIQGTIDVSGRDLAGRLVDAKTRDPYRNLKGSEIVQQVAAQFGLTADVDATDTMEGAYYHLEHDKLTQDSFSKTTSYWDLLCFLAEHDDRDLWVDGKTVHYKERVDLQAAPAVPLVWTPPAGPAAYPSAAADISLRRSLTVSKGVKVIVKIWDARSKKAQAITYPTSAAQDAQEYVWVKAGWSAQKALVFVQAQYADIIRHERVVDVDMPGELTLTPRSVIAVSGLPGTTFNVRYAVDEMTREFSMTGSFRQTLVLKNHSTQSAAAVS